MLPSTLSAKKQTGSSFWQIFNKRCPYKLVLFDEIDANCGIVNSVLSVPLLYLSDMTFCMPFDLLVNVCIFTRCWWGGGALIRPICLSPPVISALLRAWSRFLSFLDFDVYVVMTPPFSQQIGERLLLQEAWLSWLCYQHGSTRRTQPIGQHCKRLRRKRTRGFGFKGL